MAQNDSRAERINSNDCSMAGLFMEDSDVAHNGMNAEERLYAWVDENSPPQTRVSPRRVGKLFVAIMVASIVGGLPAALLTVGLQEFDQLQKRQAEQEKLAREWKAAEKAAREGRTGPAGRRLFGIDDPPQRPSPAKKPWRDE